MKRLARNLEKAAKKAVFAILGASSRSRQETPVTALRNISRIIVIRPNYRIGNAILSTAIIAPLQERFPEAEIHFLVTDKTAPLFANLPVDHVAAVSRSAILRPWRTLSLLRNLRAQRYDLAVQLAPGSLSGMIMSSLLGARYVMGKPKGDAGCWYDIKVNHPIDHAYDTGPVFSNTLGTVGHAGTQLALSDEEKARALAQLQALGLQADIEDSEGHEGSVSNEGRIACFVAVFVGGHADKVCPLSFWLDLIKGLDQAEKRFVVFVGPEETALLPHLRQALGSTRHGVLCPPQPLRIFAAMLARARIMITPDSGPMHMAAALKVPVAMMLQTRKSLAFVPPGASSQVIRGLNVARAVAAADQIMNDENESVIITEISGGQTMGRGGRLVSA